jgi:hypothetical protein
MAPKNPAVQKRLAAALRQNLRRRKEAGRARAKPVGTDAAMDAAGERGKAAPGGPENASKPD